LPTDQVLANVSAAGATPTAVDEKWVKVAVAEKVPVRRRECQSAQWLMAASSDAGGRLDAVKSVGCACSMSRSLRSRIGVEH